MKKLSIISGVVLILALMAAPAFPISYKFDMCESPGLQKPCDQTDEWEEEYTLSAIDETVQVDVYLYDESETPCYTQIFVDFSFDEQRLLVEDEGCWAYINGNGFQYGDCVDAGGGNRVIWLMSVGGVTELDHKFLLGSILLSAKGGDCQIEASQDIESKTMDCSSNEITPDDAIAIIHGPCGVEVDPSSAEVATGKTLQFSASPSGSACEGLTPSTSFTWEITTPEYGSAIDPDTGLYTAGCLVNKSYQEGDTIKVTDNEYGGIATAVVKILGYSITKIKPGNCLGHPAYCSFKVKSGVTEKIRVVETENCCPINDNKSFQWSIDPPSSIGSTIITNPDGTGSYMSGGNKTGGDIIDNLIVKDINNCCGEECASIDGIEVTVSPCELELDPQNPIIGAGGNIQFKGSGACCPPYHWELTVDADIGSTLGATGLYRAGRGFLDCEPVTETIMLTDACGSLETEVTVKACQVTISHKSKSVKPGETIKFSATSDVCCENEPCYTWEISAAGGTGNTTGSTINSNGLYRAGGNAGIDTVVVTDPCNFDAADRAIVNVITTTTTSIPTGPECRSNADCDDRLFCNGAEICVGGRCHPGSDPCPDDELFCTGVEGCDEDNDVCTQTGNPCTDPTPICDEDGDTCVECLKDADCDNGLFCDGEESCEDGICQAGEPVVCEDNGDFCDGDEVCDEALDECVSSGNPCPPPGEPKKTRCDEEYDICVEPGPPPLFFKLIPNSALRSHLIPLPLFMFIVSDDPGTKFDRTATVSFSGDALTPPLTFVLSEDLILIFSLITPAGLGVTGSIEVEVTVTTTEGEGIKTLTLIMLPFILDEGKETLKGDVL